jgi:hypothetical protein
MSALITNISRTTDSIYWRYTIDATGAYDVWLNGQILAENETDAYVDLLSSEAKPPPIEVVDYGARALSTWASQYMQVQFFAENHTVFSIQEWRSGTIYSTQYVDVTYPNRYVTMSVRMRASDAVGQTWTVRPAGQADNGQYYTMGAPLLVAVQRHYLPSPPVKTYTYNTTTRILRIA